MLCHFFIFKKISGHSLRRIFEKSGLFRSILLLKTIHVDLARPLGGTMEPVILHGNPQRSLEKDRWTGFSCFVTFSFSKKLQATVYVCFFEKFELFRSILLLKTIHNDLARPLGGTMVPVILHGNPQRLLEKDRWTGF